MGVRKEWSASLQAFDARGSKPKEIQIQYAEESNGKTAIVEGRSRFRVSGFGSVCLFFSDSLPFLSTQACISAAPVLIF